MALEALETLVEYFNDRFGREHETSFRPFIAEAGVVSGLFGPIRVKSQFTPIRLAANTGVIAGHKAKVSVSTYQTRHFYSDDVENLLVSTRQTVDYESIINFDRLSRTVHLLNYLPVSHLAGVVVLDVDPRHILAIKEHHGAYFEDVIVRCGLETNKIVIMLTLSKHFKPYFQALADGLANYRQRGYGIGIKLEVSSHDDEMLAFISGLAPDYVCLADTEEMRAGSVDTPLTRWQELKTWVTQTRARSLVQLLDQKKSEVLARQVGFELVHGAYYADIPST
jgi:hypothetical protein